MKKRVPNHNIEDTDFYFGLAILCAAMGSYKLAVACLCILGYILFISYIASR